MEAHEPHWKGLALGSSVRRVDPALLAVAALLLLGGLAYARTTAPAARPVRALGGALRLTLPAGWTGSERAGVYTASRPSLDGLTPSIQVRRVPAPAPEATERPAGDFLVGAEPDVAPASPALAMETALNRMEDERRRSGIG